MKILFNSEEEEKTTTTVLSLMLKGNRETRYLYRRAVSRSRGVKKKRKKRQREKQSHYTVQYIEIYTQCNAIRFRDSEEIPYNKVPGVKSKKKTKRNETNKPHK